MRRITIAYMALICALVFLVCGCTKGKAMHAEQTSSEQDAVERSFAQVYTLRFPAKYSQYAQSGVFATSETENGQEADGTPYVHKLYADFMPYESLDLIQELELMGDEMPEQEYDEKLTAVYDSLRAVFVITVYDKRQLGDGVDIPSVTGFANNILLGEWGDYLCYASTPTRDETGMEKESLTAYRDICGGIQEIFDSIQPMV